ncbi:MAG: helix-turn-helix domain-containing protein [Bacteroidota bacterium]
MDTYILNEQAELAANFINTTSRHIFLTGKAGTGKTTFLRYIVENTFKNTVVAAPTGIAAINAGGVTLHSLLQLPFGAYIPEAVIQNQETYFQVNTPLTLRNARRMRKDKLDMIREMDLLIIDEVSMLRSDLLDCMDVVLRSVRRRSAEPFGGLQLLFIGDLMQLPPVVKEQEWAILRQYYASPYFFHAHALKAHQPLTVELTKIYRQRDSDFIDILNRLRNNQQTDADISYLNQFYEAGCESLEQPGYIHLTTHNRKADRINETRLSQLSERSYTYKAEIDGDFSENLYPAQFELELKVGAQVMFIKNDPSGEGQFFNGKIGKVSKLTKSGIWVLPDGGGEEIEVEPYQWDNKRYELDEQTNEIEAKELGSFEQYPLKLAWAVTIHKSQGLTFEKAILDMADTFAPGQLYVALSRLTSLDGLKMASRLPQNPPDIEATLRAFVEGFPDAQALSDHLRADRRGFLFKFAQQAFDFSGLLRLLEKHFKTFDSQATRSPRQGHRAWTRKLLEDTRPLTGIGTSFIGQIATLLRQENQQTYLSERSQKALGYFEPIMFELISRLQLHKKSLKGKQVKSYKDELKELVEVYVFHIRQIKKFSLLATGDAEGQLPNKDAMREWERQLTSFLYPVKKKKSGSPTLDFSQTKPKVNTKEVSFNLYKQGKSMEEIADERGLVVGTIRGHLTHYVELGKIDVHDLMPKERLDKILSVASDNLGSRDIKNQLPDDYSYGEIKLAMAYKNRQKS